nr:hypothetical protein CFP56_27159 [Quercus suber]
MQNDNTRVIPPCNEQLLWSTSNPTVNKLEIPAWLIGGHFISIQRRRTHQYVYQTVPLNDQPRMVLVLFLSKNGLVIFAVVLLEWIQ